MPPPAGKRVEMVLKSGIIDHALWPPLDAAAFDPL